MTARYLSQVTEIPAVSTARRVLADRAQPEAEAGAVEHPPCQRHREEGEIDQHIVSGHQLGIDPPDGGQRRGPVRKRQDEFAEPCRIDQLRRLAALVEPCCAQKRGKSGGQDVDGKTGNDLVAPVGDAGKAVQQRQRDRDRDCGRRPIQADSVTAAVAPAAKAAPSILPSRPMSKMPDRSE